MSAEQGFALAWGLVGILMVAFVGLGAMNDLRMGLVGRHRDQVLRELAILLFDSDLEAEAVHGRVGHLPKRVLLDVIQSLAIDMEGEACHRLQTLARTRGLDRHIRRLGRSRRWRSRIQAAQLQYLIVDPGYDRARLLGDPHRLCRARAAESLTPEQATELIPELLQLLGEPHKIVRRAAKDQLLAVGDVVVPYLVDFLEDPDNSAVIDGLEVAANLGDARLIAPLTKFCRSQEPNTRTMAATAIGLGGGKGAADLLTDMLSDPEPAVRVAAIRGLETLRIERSVSSIARCPRDHSWAVRRASGRALDLLGPSGHLMLRRYLNDQDPFARGMARQVLDARATQTGLQLVPALAGRHR